MDTWSRLSRSAKDIEKHVATLKEEDKRNEAVIKRKRSELEHDIEAFKQEKKKFKSQKKKFKAQLEEVEQQLEFNQVKK